MVGGTYAAEAGTPLGSVMGRMALAAEGAREILLFGKVEYEVDGTACGDDPALAFKTSKGGMRAVGVRL